MFLLRVRWDVAYIVLAVARLACDPWSAMLLGRQLVDLLLGQPSPPPAPLAFAQLALREARILSGGDGVLAHLKHYWGHQCDQPAMSFPPDPAGSPADPLARTHFRMSRSNIVAFSELVVLPSHSRIDAADTTMLLCLAAWLISLQQTLGLADFVVGLWLSPRDVHPPGAAGLAAPLAAPLPLRVRLSRARSFVDVVIALGRLVAQARSRAQFPAAGLLAPARDNVAFPVQVFSLKHHRCVFPSVNLSVT